MYPNVGVRVLAKTPNRNIASQTLSLQDGINNNGSTTNLWAQVLDVCKTVSLVKTFRGQKGQKLVVQ